MAAQFHLADLFETACAEISDRIAIKSDNGHLTYGEFNARICQSVDGRLRAVSGDSARMDQGGFLTVFGRGSTCITTGRENMLPEKGEEAVRNYPASFDAVVTGERDERWGERVVGTVSPRNGIALPDVSRVKEPLASRLAGCKLPKALAWVEAVKRSPAGEQDYRWAQQIAETA